MLLFTLQLGVHRKASVAWLNGCCFVHEKEGWVSCVWTERAWFVPWGLHRAVLEAMSWTSAVCTSDLWILTSYSVFLYCMNHQSYSFIFFKISSTRVNEQDHLKEEFIHCFFKKSNRKHELNLLNCKWITILRWQVKAFSATFLSCMQRFFFYHACVNAQWRKEGCVVTQAGSFSSKQHCLFLPLPGFLCLCSLACATLFTELWLLLNASHAYDSGLLPGEGSVPVKNTHARMVAQMHDSLMSQRPEAKHACSHGFTLWY